MNLEWRFRGKCNSQSLQEDGADVWSPLNNETERNAPFVLHHSIHTTHHTLLILHHSSHTTHHTPLITTTHLTPSSHTTHLIHFDRPISFRPLFLSISTYLSLALQPFRLRCALSRRCQQGLEINITKGSLVRTTLSLLCEAKGLA